MRQWMRNREWEKFDFNFVSNMKIYVNRWSLSKQSSLLFHAFHPHFLYFASFDLILNIYSSNSFNYETLTTKLAKKRKEKNCWHRRKKKEYNTSMVKFRAPNDVTNPLMQSRHSTLRFLVDLFNYRSTRVPNYWDWQTYTQRLAKHQKNRFPNDLLM